VGYSVCTCEDDLTNIPSDAGSCRCTTSFMPYFHSYSLVVRLHPLLIHHPITSLSTLMFLCHIIRAFHLHLLIFNSQSCSSHAHTPSTDERAGCSTHWSDIPLPLSPLASGPSSPRPHNMPRRRRTRAAKVVSASRGACLPLLTERLANHAFSHSPPPPNVLPFARPMNCNPDYRTLTRLLFGLTCSCDLTTHSARCTYFIPHMRHFTPTHPSLDLAIAWSTLLIFDCMIFGLTLFKSLTSLRTTGRRTETLFHVLLRDGAIYFGCVYPTVNIEHTGQRLNLRGTVGSC
jgi:hypothetical protein